MGASGSASERIQQRQDKGDRSLLNTLHGSRGQDGRGETVGHEAMARGQLQGGGREYGEVRNLPSFGNCLVVSSPSVS